MPTVGRGYWATYLVGRAEMLSQAQAEVRAQVTNEVAAAAAERKLLIGMIKHYDQQVEEYDKMLAKGRTAEGKSRQGRTVRTSTSAGTESFPLPAASGALLSGQAAIRNVTAALVAETRPPTAVVEMVRGLMDDVKSRHGAPISPGGNVRLAYIQAQQGTLHGLIIGDPEMTAVQRAASIDYAGHQLGIAVGGVGDNADAGALVTAQWDTLYDDETAPFRTSDSREGVRTQIKEDYGLGAAKGAVGSAGEVIAGPAFRQAPGRYSSSSTETLAPGEAARLAKYETPEFKMLAQAYGDDGVIDAAEAKVLTESGVDQDAFLDDVLMQRIMGRGRVTAERESLVGVRRGYREQAASQPGVDTSRERVQGLTRERYGDPVSPTQALLSPKRAKGRSAPKTMRDYAMLGAEQAATFDGDIKVAKGAEAFVSQGADALVSGNPAAAKAVAAAIEKAGIEPTSIPAIYAATFRQAERMADTREQQRLADNKPGQV